MSKFLAAAKQRSEKANATIAAQMKALGPIDNTRRDSQLNQSGTPSEHITRKNAMRGGSGSNVDLDLVTPPQKEKLRRKGSEAANSQGKDQPLQQTGGLWDDVQNWPDNQLGLYDSQETIPGEIPSQQKVSTSPPKPRSNKPTAAKSKAKPVATPQQKHVEVPSGSSSAAPGNHADKSTTPKADEKKSKLKTPKADEKKSKLKTPKAKAKSKAGKPKGKSSRAKQASKTKVAKGAKQKPVKKPAADTSKDKPDKRPATDTDDTTGKDKPDKSPATVATHKGKKRRAQDPPVHKNPGGRSSGSGIKKSAACSLSAAEPEAAAAEPQKPKRAKQPDQQGQGKANDGAAEAKATPAEVVSALQRSDTLEQEEKDKKRKAYKARKQRFYNSLVSSRTPEVLKAKAAECRGSFDEMSKLWEEWLQSNECWSSSALVIQLKQTTEFTKMGARRWMTYQEICDKYHSSDVADSIVEEKRTSRDAKTHIKRHPDCPKRDDMVLYLVWDSESEATKESTLLSTGMTAVDDEDSDDPKPKKKKHRKSSSDDDSDESSDDDVASKENTKSKKDKKVKKDKKHKKDKNGRSKKNKKGKTMTEEQKQKKEQKDREQLEKKAQADKRRQEEKDARKAYQEKVGESRKLMNQLTSKIADVRSKMARSKNLNAALRKAVCSQLEEQRKDLQAARDGLQVLVDNYEEKHAPKVKSEGEKALAAYKSVLESLKM